MRRGIKGYSTHVQLTPIYKKYSTLLGRGDKIKES